MQIRVNGPLECRTLHDAFSDSVFDSNACFNCIFHGNTVIDRPCSPDPCENGGDCMWTGLMDFTCNCTNAGFWSGDTCTSESHAAFLDILS